MAVPPLAEMVNWVLLPTLPPSTPTEPPQVSPTPMALPALPPLLTSPMLTAPPLAAEVATPPFPADAISVNCMMVCPSCAVSVGGDPCRTPGPRAVPELAAIMRAPLPRHMREITQLAHRGGSGRRDQLTSGAACVSFAAPASEPRPSLCYDAANQRQGKTTTNHSRPRRSRPVDADTFDAFGKGVVQRRRAVRLLAGGIGCERG
jgi:hypothetical protein